MSEVPTESSAPERKVTIRACFPDLDIDGVEDGVVAVASYLADYVPHSFIQDEVSVRLLARPGGSMVSVIPDLTNNLHCLEPLGVCLYLSDKRIDEDVVLFV